jgi:hypothetical protein
MSFGISATAWLAIGVGTLVAGEAYTAVKSNQAAASARNAAAQQQKDDASAQAKAQADAANEANSTRVAQKRAYQANALALGGSGDDSLGAPGASSTSNVLSTGASGSTRAAAVAPTSVLGGGSPITSAGARGAGGGGTSRSRTYTRPAA